VIGTDPARRRFGRGLFTELAVLVWAIGVAALILHAGHYLFFVADDALISLRYAERLLGGHGLTWTDGPPVEGYSNLLWILLCAALGAIGIDLIDAARVLGLAGAAAALGAIVYAYRPQSWRGLAPPLVGVLVLALSGPIAVWSIGGLEQPLVAALWAWSVALILEGLDDSPPRPRRVLLPAVLLALLVLTRPDAPVLVAALAAAHLLAHRTTRQAWISSAVLAFLPFLAWLGQLGFRLVYYDDWLPNTARVKVAVTASRWRLGMQYAAQMWPNYTAVLALALGGAGAVCFNRRPRRLLILGLPLIAWVVYVVAIGGDIFPAQRQMIPALIMLAFLAAELGTWIGRGSRLRLAAGTLTMAVGLGLYLDGQLKDGENIRAVTERWEWDGKEIGEMLSAAFGDRQPLLAADSAGCLPYFSKLPAIDMLGLNDRHIARRDTRAFGKGYPGHERGDGKYVLDRKPDLVIFDSPHGRVDPNRPPNFPGGREMVKDKRFARFYRRAIFETPDPRRVRSWIYVRAEDGKLGVERTDDAVRVPGYLVSSSPESVVRLDKKGQAVMIVTPGRPALLDRLRLPAGEWRVEVATSSGSGRLVVREADSQAVLLEAEGQGRFVLTPGTEKAVSLEIETVGENPVEVLEIVFKRP